MAITITVAPNEQDNTAQFTVTTSLVEDSTHINLRVEAELYIDGVVIAKKVKPKGITTFDFAEILKSKCLFTTPAIVDSSGTAIIDGGKTGSNLITGWTNDAHPLDFATFTTSGANWTSLVTEATATAKAYTNSIAVVAGKIYPLLFKSTTNEKEFSLQVKTTPANGNYLIWYTDDKRRYFQARTTGNIQLEVSVITSVAAKTFAGTWEMYELSANDWFAPYYVVFTEKYEDASGVTQSGTATPYEYINLFHRSNATVFTDYLTTKFLKTDGYNLSTNARSYSILKSPVTRTSSFNFAIINKEAYQVKTRITPYNSAGVAQTDVDSALQDVYSPIIAVHLNESIVASYPKAGLKLMSAASTNLTELLIFDQNATPFCNIIHLIWKNKIGGYSEYSFTYMVEKATQVTKEFYKDVNKKDKVIPTSISNQNYIKAYTPLSVTEKQLEYIQDLLESADIKWQRAAGDLVAVTVVSGTILTKNDNEFTPFQIEISY